MGAEAAKDGVERADAGDEAGLDEVFGELPSVHGFSIQ